MEFINNSNISFSLRSIPVIKLLIPYVLGIVCGVQRIWAGNLNIALLVWMVLFFLYILSYIWVNKKNNGHILHSLLLFIILLLFGWINSQRNQQTDSFFAVHHDSFKSIKGYVLEKGKESPKYTRYTFRLVEGYLNERSIKLDAKVYLYLRNDSLKNNELNYAQTILFKPQMEKIPKALNPYEFDYQNYSNIRGIYLQQFLNKGEYDLLDEKNGNIIIKQARRLRNWVVAQYRRYISQEKSFEIATALVLGYREEMSRDTFELFSNTGTIHILSVSGMHVGMLFAIVFFILYPVSRRVRLILCMLIIWAYVIFTGMSPSILRAGTMISFYLLGRLIYRETQTENILLITAFILLLIKPSSLFDIGFQLSFLAVGGILLFFPLFKSIYYPQSIWGQRIIDIIYISLAAQIFTTPLTLYYFERFPNLFLIANLFVVFPASILMCLGLALPLLPIEILKEWVGQLIIWITKVMESCLLLLDSFPYAVTTGLIISVQEVLLLFAFLGLIPVVLRIRTKKIISLIYIVIVLMIGVYSYKEIRKLKDSEFRIYNVGQNLAVSAISNGKIVLLTDTVGDKLSFLDYQVFPNLSRWGKVQDIRFIPIKSQNAIIQVNTFKIQIWQQKSSLYTAVKDVDVILVRNNAVLDFSYLAEESNKEAGALYVFDGTNLDEYIERSILLLEQFDKRYYVLKNNYSYVWEEV